MASLAALVRDHTTLDRDQVSHLNRLTSEWHYLADFCFADLLLYVPTTDDRWLIVGQVRPATGQTVYHTDWVGSFANPTESAVLQRAASAGEVTEGDVEVEEAPEEVARMLAVPVLHNGANIAVMTREWVERSGRTPGELERTYNSIFDRFAAMITEGSFPYPARNTDVSVAPRVGDGVMSLDAEGRVRYLSPNANSALHRVGIHANAAGMRLAELGFHDDMVRKAYEQRIPIIEEFEQGDVALLCRCMPILSEGEIAGGVLLVRDVTDVRKRDRMLMSKDATIREIHHRVKNNLQTISSLLRLQARRLENPEAKAAVSESVRRIRTIALVHESLSREPGDDVTFIEIVRPLLRLAEESLQSPDRPVRFTLVGDGGRIPARVATPLSVVLTELLQNAVDHGFPEGSGGGRVVVSLDNDVDLLNVVVVDDGRGLAGDFDLSSATGLGLSIVRTLVTTELNGEINMRPATSVDLERAGLADHGASHGTVVELSVPLGE